MKDLEDRAIGSFRGLAIGDALGAPVEFTFKGSFPIVENYRPTIHFDLPPGYWTDDSSMALCLADSLLEKTGYDSFDAMDKYYSWLTDGYNSSVGFCFDVGTQTVTALKAYKNEPKLTFDDVTTAAGNGAIMRLAPAAIVSTNLSVEESLRLFEVTTIDTHFSYEAIDTSKVFGMLLRSFILGEKDKNKALDEALTIVGGKLAHMRAMFSQDESEVSTSGYCITSLGAAWWAFFNSSSFDEAVLKAVNLGGDADTIGAITGQLAGAYYGDESISAYLKDGLYDCERFEISALSLLNVKQGVIRDRLETKSYSFVEKFGRFWISNRE